MTSRVTVTQRLMHSSCISMTTRINLNITVKNLVKAITFGKSSQTWPKDFNALMIWFFRRIGLKIYRKSVSETLFLHLVGGGVRRSHGHFTSSEHGVLCLPRRKTQNTFSKVIKEENIRAILDIKQM